MGRAVQSVGRMRRFAKSKVMDDTDADEVSTEDSGVLTPNRPVEESTRHYLKWVAQVSEYWPLLDEEMLELTGDKPLNHHPFTPSRPLPNAGESSRWALCTDTPWSPSPYANYSLSMRTCVDGQTRPAGRATSHAPQVRTHHREEFPRTDKSQEEMIVEGARKRVVRRSHMFFLS